jgi:hypothetical protein
VTFRIFICADHGLAIIYFLQSEILDVLNRNGVEVVLITDDGLVPEIQARFGKPAIVVEGIRQQFANQYAAEKNRDFQWWLNFLRRVGSSDRINTEAMDSYVNQVSIEQGWRRRILMPGAKLAIKLLRRSRLTRRSLLEVQRFYNPRLYRDLFERYQPDLVVASTYGWRLDRYLIREADRRNIPTAAVIVGWDNPSSYGLPAAHVDWVNCWSEIQKNELVLGADFSSERVHIGGIPSYDGYFRKDWLIPRQDYFRLHGLDPNRKLIAYAASFVSFAPNFRNIEAIARLVSGEDLAMPCQLLVRLHPNHFSDDPLFSSEREKIYALARSLPHVHVVEPIPMGSSLSYYSGEDMPEKSSMMAHADVFLTVYSTMVVETAIHGTPIVSVCLDTPGGWNWPRKYSLPLSKIGNWPTHDRFRKSGAGKVVLHETELVDSINTYLLQPSIDREKRERFVKDECTYTDGSAGRRTGEFIVKIMEQGRPQ